VTVVNKLTLSRSQSRMEGAALPSSARYKHTNTSACHNKNDVICIESHDVSFTLQGCQLYLYRGVNCSLMACTVIFLRQLLPESKGRQKIETCWIHSRCLIMTHTADSDISNPTMVKARLLIFNTSQALATTQIKRSLLGAQHGVINIHDLNILP